MNREEYLCLLLNKGIAHSRAVKENQTATPDKYPQGYFKVKNCKHCGKQFVPQAPSEHYCSDFCKKYAHIDRYYITNYHISLEQYLDLAEAQDYKCKLCGRENFAMGAQHSGALVVDHDHKTGQVRGLLCHNCNRALGLLDDNKQTIYNILDYLESATTISKESTP